MKIYTIKYAKKQEYCEESVKGNTFTVKKKSKQRSSRSKLEDKQEEFAKGQHQFRRRDGQRIRIDQA